MLKCRHLFHVVTIIVRLQNVLHN